MGKHILKRSGEKTMIKCICGHKKQKHDFAISETDNIGHHCLGSKDCKCRKFTVLEEKAPKESANK